MSIKFVFLILPHIHILDLAGADQAIHESIDFDADFEIEYCGIGEQVVTTSGLPFGSLQHFSNVSLSSIDFLIIPGTSYLYVTSVQFLNNSELFEWIRLQHHIGVSICSICMGAFVLAETGILDHKSCTTHFKKTKELQEHYPKLRVVENILFTEESNIYTSAGIAAGIDLILHIIEKLQGSYFAHLVARELVIYNRRNGNDKQESELLKFRNHIHTGVHKAQDYIITHIDKNKSLADLAKIVNMSERNFTRIFKKETGVTVNDYITKIRVIKAKEFCKNPDLSMVAIANNVGLRSEKHLKRILDKEYS